MGTDYIKCYGEIQQELDDAKHTLVTLNDNIRRIIGRNPVKDISRSEKHKAVPQEIKRNESERSSLKNNDQTKFKRRSYNEKSVFNRLSSRSGDEETRPRLNSRVIRELPTRQEIVEAQGTDSESRARNRRMFGSLLGTLHKFCQEESRLKQKEDKKAQIEKKLEEQELKERATLRKERESLFMDRKRKQLEIRKLELKINRLKDFEMWESSMSQLQHHIRTKTKPHIYFRPRHMSKKTEKLLSESQASIQQTIEKNREALNKELADLEINFKYQEDENEDQYDGVANNDSYTAEETSKTLDIHIKEESHSIKSSNSTCEVNPKKGDIDSKENKSKNLNEPALSSSVVVVGKNLQKDLKKTTQ